MTAHELGALIGCSENRLNPGALAYCDGLATKMASSDGLADVLPLLKLASQTFEATGRRHTFPARLVELVIKSADVRELRPFARDIADHVARTVRVLEPLKKQAFSDLASGAGLAARGAMYGSVGIGSGLGALYYLLSRHANQDSANIESMQKQVDYYDELGQELESSMRNKYRYNDVQ